MYDVIVGAVIVALSLFMLLIWAVAEGLLTRARRREADRDAIAVTVGLLPEQTREQRTAFADALEQAAARRTGGVR